VPSINYGALTEDDILANQFIRLNTIYKIVDKSGMLIDFRMNAEQYDFYKNMHNLNLILKSRQRGMTTLIQLYLLDTALFRPNTSCGVIAHTKDDANKFFDKKIKLAYENMPYDFAKRHIPDASQDREGQLKFSNGSYLTVGTSMRSDTLQYLHVSEFGKLCARFPDKAAEVVSGALNTVASGNWITIESTGEGSYGSFYDMCQIARRNDTEGVRLSPMDYRFFFYPWWTAEEYVLETHQEPSDEDARYFEELEKFSNIRLSRAQKNWYVAKRREQTDRMNREYPSTPDEAFRGVIDGAPFSRIMSQLRRQGHIRRVPWAKAIPVNTFWDLGRNDMTAIWFHQRVGFEDRFIDYYQDNFRPLSDYATVLFEKPYIYGEHYLPHDVEVTDLSRSDAMSRREVLESLGVRPIITVERVKSEEEGVNMTREMMGSCYFDEENTVKGLECLENVRYRFDEKLQSFQPNLMRTKAKHGADSFMQWGHGYRHRRSGAERAGPANDIARENRLSDGAGRARRISHSHVPNSGVSWKT
jgi:hypothetical protein